MATKQKRNPPATKSLADLMGSDGADYIGEVHDPMSVAPPEEAPVCLFDERVSVQTLDGALHVVDTTLNAYASRRMSDKQVQTVLEIVKTATGVLAAKARKDPAKDPAAPVAVEEQVRMLTTSGPFGVFTQASRTLRVSEPPLLADPMRVLTGVPE
jgi:hypothetical protein